uniref:GTP pyrophosphokinase n=1 Tax=Ndongobacter massiliensis TaxID=1871025 RepID=UPI000931626B|nr:GTP pyrophosphokinase [Ndongobacter massiliensis]
MIAYLKALFIMLKAHRGQKDKGGHPYFLHPLRVALGVEGKDARIVALLHDVVEDSDYTFSDLGFLSKSQREALEILTHDKEVAYFDYIQTVKNNRIAREVKKSDLRQNMDLSRLSAVTEKDRLRRQKYKAAYEMLN